MYVFISSNDIRRFLLPDTRNTQQKIFIVLYQLSEPLGGMLQVLLEKSTKETREDENERCDFPGKDGHFVSEFCGKLLLVCRCVLPIVTINRLLSGALLTLTEERSIFGRAGPRWSMAAKPT